MKKLNVYLCIFIPSYLNWNKYYKHIFEEHFYIFFFRTRLQLHTHHDLCGLWLYTIYTTLYYAILKNVKTLFVVNQHILYTLCIRRTCIFYIVLRLIEKENSNEKVLLVSWLVVATPLLSLIGNVHVFFLSINGLWTCKCV